MSLEEVNELPDGAFVQVLDNHKLFALCHFSKHMDNNSPQQAFHVDDLVAVEFLPIPFAQLINKYTNRSTRRREVHAFTASRLEMDC